MIWPECNITDSLSIQQKLETEPEDLSDYIYQQEIQEVINRLERENDNRF